MLYLLRNFKVSNIHRGRSHYRYVVNTLCLQRRRKLQNQSTANFKNSIKIKERSLTITVSSRLEKNISYKNERF